MTVSSTTPTISYQYTGPGAYPFSFLVYKTSDIQVTYTDVDGVPRELADTEFTVAISSTTDGGDVVTISPVDTDGLLTIRRVLPITQEVDWVNNDPLDAEILERSFDRVVMIEQQLAVSLAQGNATIEWRGDWLPNTDYGVRDMVVYDGVNWYYCLIEHTSSTDFDADLASGVWLLALDVARLEDLVALAAQSEANARASAESAEASATAANSSEVNSGDSEANSAMSEINAANCASEAYQFRNEAEAFRDEAEQIVAAGKVVDVMLDEYFVALADQTTFYISNPTPQAYLMVFMNSRKLRLGEDFTTDNPALASSVILDAPAKAGDEIDVTAFNYIGS